MTPGSLLIALLLAGVFAVGSLLVWRAAGPRGDPWDPSTPLRVWLLVHLATIGVGSVALVATTESFGAGPTLAAYATVAVGLGATLAARRWGVPAKVPGPREVGPLQPITVIGAGLLGLAGFLVIALTTGVPFLVASPISARAALTGIPFDLVRFFVPPTALVAMALYLARPSRTTALLAAGGLGAGLAVTLALASRALPLEIALGALLLAWWTGRRPPLRALVALGLVALIAFASIQLVRARVDRGGALETAAYAAERTINRVLLIQPRVIDVVVRTYPTDEPFLGGATYTRTITRLVTGETPRSLGYLIYERLFPGAPPAFAAPGLLGELWANWGPLALAGMFLFGVAGVAMGHGVARLRPEVADAVLAALVTVALARTYAFSLNGLLVVLAVALVWRFAATLPNLPPWAPFPRRQVAAGPTG